MQDGSTLLALIAAGFVMVTDQLDTKGISWRAPIVDACEWLTGPAPDKVDIRRD